MPDLAYLYIASLITITFFLAYRGIKFSLLNFFFGIYFIYYGPAFFSYHSDPNYYNYHLYKSASLILSACVFFVMSGSIIFRLILGGKIKNYDNWTSKEAGSIYINKYTLLIAYFISFCIISVTFILSDSINNLITAIDPANVGDELLLSATRAESESKGPFAGIYVYFISSISRFICYLVFGYGVINNNKFFKWLGYMQFFLIAIALLSTLNKSGLVFFLVQTALFYSFIFNIKINIKFVLILGSIIFSILIGIYLILTNAGDSNVAIELLFYRLFEEPNRVLDLYVDSWPNIYPHTNGMNIRLFHNFYSDTDYYSAAQILTGKRPGASFNGIFVLDAWVDFSYTGVIIQSFFVGLLLEYLDYRVFKKNNYVNKAMAASLIIGLISLNYLGLITCLIGYGLIMIPLSSILFRLKLS